MKPGGSSCNIRNITPLSLIYWLHINDLGNICNFDKHFTYQSLSSDINEETSTYDEQIKCFLQLPGLNMSSLRYKFFKEINSFIVNFDKLTTRDQFLFFISSEDTEIIALFLVFIDGCVNICQSSEK